MSKQKHRLGDGLVSMANDYGARTANRRYVATRTLSDKELIDLESDNWIISKYINKRSEDMVKKPREIETTLSESTQQALERACIRLNTKGVSEEALKYGSLLGDSMVLAVTSYEDGDTPEGYMAEKLDLSKERISRFIVLDKTAYKADDDIDKDVLSRNFGNPTRYMVNGNMRVHYSRVHIVKAGKKPFSRRKGANGWRGVSDVQGIYMAVQMHDAVVLSISDLLEESKTDVIKVEGFNKGIAAGREDDYIQVGMAMKTIKSAQNMLLIDKLAEWEQKELTFGGLVDIWKQSMSEAAGALDMPLTLVFGQSAAGFATGEEDNQNYQNSINSKQESRLRPLWDFFDQFLFDDLKLNPSDFEFSYTFPPIGEIDEVKVADVLLKVAQALQILLQEGVINEAQAAKEVKRMALIFSIDDKYIKGLEDAIEEFKKAKSAAESETDGADAEQEGRGLLPQPAA